MRITYAAFMDAQQKLRDAGVLALRQFIFVKLPDPLGDASPVTGDPKRVWAIVEDEALIAEKRIYIPAEDRIYVGGVGRRVDYDPVERPVLIVHDVE